MNISKRSPETSYNYKHLIDHRINCACVMYKNIKTRKKRLGLDRSCLHFS